MGLLTALLTEHSRRQGQKEQSKIQALTGIIGNDQLPDELREWAKSSLLEDKAFKPYKPAMGMIFDAHDEIRKGSKQSQGGQPGGAQGQPGMGIDAAKQRSVDMAQGPPQVAPMPGMGPMDVARRTTEGAQPQAQGAPDLVSGMPQQRLTIQPEAAPGPTLQYRAQDAAQAQEMAPPTRLADMPQTVTRMTPQTPSPFRPIPPMPGTPEAGGGQPSAERAGTPRQAGAQAPALAGGIPAGQPRNQWARTRDEQDERTLRVYKSQQDILRENKIAEEKAKEASGGLKSNLQRVVIKKKDGTLVRADQDMRHPGVFFTPGGASMTAPMPDEEILTESELDRDDAAAVRKQDKEEKDAAKKEKEQQDAADIDQVVDAIVKGHQPPDMSRMYGKSLKVKAAMAKKYPDFNLANAELDYRGMQRWISTQQGPQMVKLRGATNFAVEGLDTLDAPRPPDWKKGDPDPKDNDLIGRAAKTAAGSKYKRLNRAYLDAAKNGVFGEQAASDATRLDVQIAELQQELAVVYKGGNSPTDLGLNKAGEMLKSEWSDRVLRDAIDLGRTNLRIRLNSIKHTLPESVSGGANPYAPQPGASPFGPLPQMPAGAAPTGGAGAGAGGGGTSGGYIVGRAYGGMKYLGGAPDNAMSWGPK